MRNKDSSQNILQLPPNKLSLTTKWPIGPTVSVRRPEDLLTVLLGGPAMLTEEMHTLELLFELFDDGISEGIGIGGGSWIDGIGDGCLGGGGGGGGGGAGGGEGVRGGGGPNAATDAILDSTDAMVLIIKGAVFLFSFLSLFFESIKIRDK